MSDIQATAHEALDCGLSVLAVGLDKRPLLAEWRHLQKRQATTAEVDEWFARWPGAQLAVVTGAVSGVDVVDFDVLNATWPPPMAELPTDVVVRTPRGGSLPIVALDGVFVPHDTIYQLGWPKPFPALYHHVNHRARWGQVDQSTPQERA